MANNIMDLFPVAVKQLTPIVNILDAIEKGPTTGPASFNRLMDNNYNILSIVQIGAGGTGGYVAAEIMKILGGLPLKIKEHIYYTIVDGDAFEEKNLGRQLCTEDDIGVNKAVSLIDNFAEIYDNLDGHVRAYPCYLEHMEDLEAITACLVKPTCSAVFTSPPISKDGKLVYKHSFGRYHSEVLEDKGFITAADMEEIKRKAIRDAALDTKCSVFFRDNTNNSDAFRKAAAVFVDPNANGIDIDFSKLADINANCKVYTIIIDCVDKTKPRKLIHDWLEAQYTLPSALEISVMNDKDFNTCMDDPIRVPHDEATGEAGPLVALYNTYKEKLQGDVIRFKRMKPGTYDIPINRVVHETARNLNGVEDTYIISSGNGKYTGQVYWGRYSRVVPNARPVRYEDFAIMDKNMSTILSSDTAFSVGEMLDSTGKCYDSSIPFWTSSEPNHAYVYNFTERAYEADVYYSLYDSNGSDMIAVNKDEYVGARSLINLPYEWNEKNGCFVVDTTHPTISNKASYMSSFVSVPSPYNRHPDLIDVSKDDKEDQMSCAERAAENVQNIAANKTAANIVVNYFRQILNGMFPLEKDSVRLMETTGVQFDVRTNSFKPELLTKSYLTNYDSFKLWEESGRDRFIENDTIGVIKHG